MSYDLYVVTDERLSKGLSHLQIAVQAAKGGADVVQLRDKHMPSKRLFEVAVEIKEELIGTGAILIVNDRVDVAIAARADGVHLGQDDLPLRSVREMAPSGFIIGVSVGTVAEAMAAERDGADYIALSPLFDTDSKHDAGTGHGLGRLREVRQATALPLVAIGGVNARNLCQVIEAGADGVAVVSAVVSQDDVCSAARSLKDEVLRCKRLRAQAPSSTSGT
jgi:thiamine-phosphate pyrophosphorylase